MKINTLKIKLDKKNKKTLITTSIVTSLILVFSPVTAFANIIHRHSVSFPLGTGIYYEQSRRITRNGLVDVHIVTVDLTNPYVTVGPSLPANLGGRDSTTTLLQNSGAVAGINADFFNMGRYPSTPYGQVVQNGIPLQITRQEGYAATFGIDIYNTPFIEYLAPDIVFYSGGWPRINIRDINKINGNIIASVFDRNALYNTVGIDGRQPYLVKIVVDQGYITYISYPGEHVHIPENGFIVVLAENYAYYVLENIHVGQEADVEVRTSFDMDSIWNAIGGGGQVLRHGQVVSGWIPSPNARHPRSAVGFNQDGSTIFLVTVDGRSHSIGATHAEIAAILLELGAYHAMHLDGGGSTAMGIRNPGTENVRIANLPSDGGQRRVVNALGVFNSAPTQVITSVDIRTFPREHVFVGDALNVYQLGLDDHLTPFALSDAAEFNVWANIAQTGNQVFPTVPGPLDMGLSYGDLGVHITIPVLELAEIVPNYRSLDMNTGDTANLNFSGISPLGHRGPLNQVQITVMPEETGTFANGVFTAGTVSGVIQARVGGITTYIGVNVNEMGQVVHPVGNVARNPYRAILNMHGAGFDITVVGNTSLYDFLEMDELSHFINYRNDALANFRYATNLAVFAGRTEVDSIDNLATTHWTAGYSLQMVNNNTALVSLNASAGSITGTSIYNWNFMVDIDEYNPNHVIFIIDRPIASLPAHERQMLLPVLEEMAQIRDVFVVSSQGTETTNTMQNGITHINLGSLFYEYEPNPDFNILRFRIGAGGIEFDFHN